jgi:hypothetical protein
MKGSFLCCGVAIGLLLSHSVYAQTSCGSEHREPGVFICYPNPSLNTADSTLPQIFHISAQGNAPAGKTIGSYMIAVDNRVVYQNRMITPVQRLAIELNLKSSVAEGLHTLRVSVDGAGAAEVKGIRFRPLKNMSFCEPAGMFEMPICSPSNPRPPLTWAASRHLDSQSGASELFSGYLSDVQLYGENLDSLEADVADAAAVDSHGSLYIALHSFADVELRKYASNGSITYDSVIRSCGDGFLSVTALAVDEVGHAWIAGNTTACLAATPGALQPQIDDNAQPHGFVMMLDTSKPNAMAPLYVTYTANAENEITAIRADRHKNVYIAGMAAAGYPHEAVLGIPGTTSDPGKKAGFVSVLNPSGSRLLWSTLLQGAQLTALAVDGTHTGHLSPAQNRAGNGAEAFNPTETVFVTGRVDSPGRRDQGDARRGGNILVAGIAANGKRLSYAARLGSNNEEGRAISTTSDGRWLLIAGATDSPDGLAPVVVAIEPCMTGAVYSRSFARSEGALEIAALPALDAFAAEFSPALVPAKPKGNGLRARVQIAPPCVAETR